MDDGADLVDDTIIWNDVLQDFDPQLPPYYRDFFFKWNIINHAMKKVQVYHKPGVAEAIQHWSGLGVAINVFLNR